MAVNVTIDGTPCTIEKLDDGCIRVTHTTPQINAMHGPETGGEVSYLVHPAQKNQYEFVNGMLPERERGTAGAQTPWWSFAGGAREKRDKEDRAD